MKTYVLYDESNNEIGRFASESLARECMQYIHDENQALGDLGISDLGDWAIVERDEIDALV